MPALVENMNKMVSWDKARPRVKSRMLHQEDASPGQGIGTLTLAGTLRDSAGIDPDSMRVLDTYAVVYVLRGPGWYKDARSDRRPLRSGDLILVFPGLGHSYGPGKGATWDEIYACFSGPVFDVWRKCGILDERAPILNLQPVDLWYQRFRNCILTTGSGARQRSLKQVCLLQEFLADALDGQSRIQAGRDHWFEEACHYLDTVEKAGADLRELSKDLGISYESFRKRFREKAGMGPGHYRDRRRLERARALLGQYRLSNKQLAEMLGFSDEFHFSRSFKAAFHASPSAFRRHL